MSKNHNILHMQIFCELIEKASFTKAAIKFNCTPSSISKILSQIEEDLNTKLVLRTTRNVVVTDVGKLYFDYCKKSLSQFHKLTSTLTHFEKEPAGDLRVCMPSAVGQFIVAKHLADFVQQYPAINLFIELGENVVDLRSTPYDIAIRSFPRFELSNQNMTYLCSHQKWLVASPTCINNHEEIASPNELNQHNLINCSSATSFKTWTFTKGNENQTITPKASIDSNNYAFIKELALAGVGVGNLYDYVVKTEITEGKLVRVLPQWQQDSRDLYILHDKSINSSPKVAVFIKFLKEAFDQSRRKASL